MGTNKSIYVVFGFDMETDCGSFSLSYEGVVKGTPLVLELLKSHNIKGTFFFTGEAARRYPELVKKVCNAGHEIGCHGLYHETVGDPIFDIPGCAFLLPEEVENRLRIATDLVSEAAGLKPTSFRSPRLWGSTTHINALEKLGYLADVSYPLYFYGKQLVPYHPSSENWLEKGDLNIVEIPNFADITVKSMDAYGRDKDQWPKFRTKGADKLKAHIKNFVDLVQSRNLDCVLAFYFHPWEFVEMPKKFRFGEGFMVPDEFLVKNCGDFALSQLDNLIQNLQNEGAEFLTSKEVAMLGKW